MLDIRLIRSEPDLVRAGLARRGEPAERLDELLAADEERRRLLLEAEELKHRKNVISKEINDLRRSGADASEQISTSRQISDRIRELDDATRGVDERIQTILLALPNLTD